MRLRSQLELPFYKTDASIILDAFRGVAALIVCMSHWRYLLFVDYPQIENHKRLFAPLYTLSTMGRQSVIVFFVLSGYLVGGHIIHAVESGKWSWRSYLLQRGIRLYIVLIPALLLGSLLDLVAIHLHLAPDLYTGLVANHITHNVHVGLNWHTLVGNLCFLQNIAVPVLGSNTPLWSLANEFWYYLVFPLGLLTFRSRYSVLSRVVMGVASISILVFVGTDIRDLFFVWMLGVLLAVIPVKATPLWLRLVTQIVYLPIFTFSMRERGILSGKRADSALGLVTFVLFWVLLGAKAPYRNTWTTRISRTSAGFSYTLYLVHVPLLMFIAAMTVKTSRWQPTSVHLLIAFTELCGVVVSAYLLALCTEFQTAKVREYLFKQVPEKFQAIGALSGRRPQPKPSEA